MTLRDFRISKRGFYKADMNDIGYFFTKENHEEKSSKFAKLYLGSINYPQIKFIVLSHILRQQTLKQNQPTFWRK